MSPRAGIDASTGVMNESESGEAGIGRGRYDQPAILASWLDISAPIEVVAAINSTPTMNEDASAQSRVNIASAAFSMPILMRAVAAYSITK